MHLLVVIALCGRFVCSHSSLLEMHWQQWKLEYNKEYADLVDEQTRRDIWFTNYQRVIKHNQNEKSFFIAMNQFSDLTDEEYRDGYLCTVDATTLTRSITFYSWIRNEVVQELDWREKGVVSAVGHQGSMCRSSWAFSASGALEGLHYKLKGQLVSLSAQQLVDCSDTYGNKGCEGGTVQNAFQYVHEEGGLCTNSSYPYIGYGWQCVSKFCKKVATCLGYVDVSDGNEDDLLNAVYTLGPVSVMVDASSYTFKYYKGGIYCSGSCSSTNVNQAMLAVGYGTDSSTGEDYWILKNSWGTSWGEDGFMRMARNRNNTCGVATLANYPIVIYT